MSTDPRPWRAPALVIASMLGISFLAVQSPEAQDQLAARDGGGGPTAIADEALTDSGGGPDAGPGGPSAAGAGPGGGRAASGGAQGPGGTKGANLQCRAGANGGGTAPGVSGNRIKLASTNVRSGTGSSFLGSSYIAMQAVVNRVNAKGGICGRLLDLRLVDDGWEASRGAGYIATFAKEGVFALPVVPSSEGLTQAITTKIVANAGIPVVGTDGMLKEQYAEPWVWPVATSTVTTMRVMAKYAYDQGGRTFGIVYDNKYKFGVEGAKAFEQYVKTLPGATLKAQVPLEPKQPSYSGDAERFNSACGNEGCQFVAMLLTPETANTYINSQPEVGGRKKGFGTLVTAGAQPLFNERFARDCKKACDGMLVWTGYNPPIGGLSADKDVAAFVDDVRSVDPQVDVTNQFMQGAYLGMKVFVAALEKVGPNLTREALRDALDSMTHSSGLSSPLTWAPGKHFANLGSQPFRITTASGDFVGFAEVGTGFIKDPTPGVVPQ